MERARSKKLQRGYTLVELMMIVVIIAISTIAFAPGFSRALVDSRVSAVSRELIRVGRRARSDTVGYLRAHLMFIDPTNRRLQLLRAPTNSCLLTDWTAAAAECPATIQAAGTMGQRCVENVFFDSMTTSDQPIGIFTEASGGSYSIGSGRAFCFAPNGLMYTGSGATVKIAAMDSPLTTNMLDAAGGGYVFGVTSGSTAPTATSINRIHRILFPIGGSPRALR